MKRPILCCLLLASLTISVNGLAEPTEAQLSEAEIRAELEAMAREDLALVMPTLLPQMQVCMATHLPAEDAGKGLLKVSFQIHPAGHTTAVNITATDAGYEALAACYQEVLLSAHFGAPIADELVEVSYVLKADLSDGNLATEYQLNYSPLPGKP